MKYVRFIVAGIILISIVVIVVLFQKFGIDDAGKVTSTTGLDFIKEIFKTILSVCLVGGVYFIYQSLVAEDKEKKDAEKIESERRRAELEKEQDAKNEWTKIAGELRQKNRDLDSQLRRVFINNYGQFRTNVRTWKIYKPTPKKFHDLLPDAIEAEGRLEALIVEAASRRTLDEEQACLIGLYRQGYQTLRQHLNDRRKLEPPHNYNKDDYHLFAMLFASLAVLLTEERHTQDAVDNQFNIDRIYESRSDNWNAAITAFSKSNNISAVLKNCAEINGNDRMEST